MMGAKFELNLNYISYFFFNFKKLCLEADKAAKDKPKTKLQCVQHVVISYNFTHTYIVLHFLHRICKKTRLA